MTKTLVSAETDQERDSHPQEHRQQDEHRSERNLQRALRRFVRPSAQILDPRQRLQAELVSAVLLAIGIWGLVVSVPYTWLLEPSVQGGHLLGVFGAFAVVALCFTLSRTRWYRVSGAVGFLVVGWLAIRGGELGDFQSSLIVVVGLLVLAAVVLPRWMAVALAIASVAMAGVVAWRAPAGSLERPFDVLFDMTFAAGSIILAVLLHDLFRKSDRRALQTSRARYVGLLETAFDGLARLDEEARVLEANSGLEELLGLEENEAIGKSLQSLLGPSILDGLTLGDCQRPLRIRRIEQGGSERDLELLCRPLENDVGFLVALRDVSKEREAVDAQLRAERLHSLSLIAGGVAHDFRNVLTAVVANLEILRRFDHDRETFERSLREVEGATLRAKGLAEQLSNFARGSAPVRERVNLEQLAYQATQLVLRGSRVRVVFKESETEPLVEVDAGQIEQVLINLLVNALEAMPGGGTVEIAIETSDEPPDSLPATSYYRLTVRDDGPGIDPQHLGHVLEPYYSTKHRGSGLGLATSASILRRHDGRLTVESEPGRGTRFSLWLPRGPAATVTAKPPDDAAERLNPRSA